MRFRKSIPALHSVPQMVALTRLFRIVDAGKRAPAAGAAYKLANILDPVPDCSD